MLNNGRFLICTVQFNVKDVFFETGYLQNYGSSIRLNEPLVFIGFIDKPNLSSL